MLILFIIISIVVLSIVLYFVFRKHKSSLKSCQQNSDCGIGQLCQNNSCCSTSCDNLSCQDANQCGQSCLKILCQPGQTCYQGNCCTPQCSEANACENDGCGGICPCSEGICYQGSCCQPENCSSGACGGEGSCGLPACSCNNAYCQPNTCCVNNFCSYQDICENSPPAVQDYLQKQWGRFCQPAPGSVAGPQCTGCELVFPAFYNNQSIAPVTGTLQCEKCLMSDGKTWNMNPPPVLIDPNVAYYQNQNGVIVSGPLVKGYCATIGCGNCVCLTDSDCQRFGCNKCVNGSCQ